MVRASRVFRVARPLERIRSIFDVACTRATLKVEVVKLVAAQHFILFDGLVALTFSALQDSYEVA